MFDLWKKKEVFVTTDINILSKVQSNLDLEKIPYTVKTVNGGTKNRESGTFWGEFGENQRYTIIYYIYVEKKDFLKAEYVVKHVTNTK